jgi:hypothetical protein
MPGEGLFLVMELVTADGDHFAEPEPPQICSIVEADLVPV